MRWVTTLWILAGCLDPAVSDEVPTGNLFPDPMADPLAAPRVQDTVSPEVLAQFSTQVAYLSGFADGQPIRYWNVNGANADFVAPMYFIQNRDGSPLGKPIIDVIPGDPGYSPWWRKVIVRVTPTWTNEKFWSREAIDAGLKLGLLEPPMFTTDVVNCPVTLEETQIPVDRVAEGGRFRERTVPPVFGWYRNQRVHWIDFSEVIQVPLGTNNFAAGDMPIFPVYILQRINQGEPIYEFVTGVDINGDRLLEASNNIFAAAPGRPRYSPLWFPVLVRTTETFRSIETSSTSPELTSEDQFIDVQSSPDGDILTVKPGTAALAQPAPLVDRTTLVNCPIQRAPGAL